MISDSVSFTPEGKTLVVVAKFKARKEFFEKN
jgi:hypothetical protein